MTGAPKFEERGIGIEFAVRAIPGAGKNEIAGAYGDAVKVRVVAPPEKGRANREIEKQLAGWLGIPAKNVTVTAGAATRDKRVRAVGIDASTFAEKLAALRCK